MFNKKKWFPLALALLLVFSQAVGVLAEAATVEAFTTVEEAYLAGREVRATAKLDWQSPGIIEDAEANELLAALFEAMTYRSTMGIVEDAQYTSSAIDIDGTQVFSMDVIAKDETTYISSPIYGPTVSLSVDEISPYFENLIKLISEMSGEDSEEMLAMYEQFSASFLTGFNLGVQIEGAEAGGEIPPELLAQLGLEGMDPDALMEALNLEAFIEAITQWAETSLAPEQYEGQVETILEVETAKANVYDITKEEFLALVEAALPPLLQNEALWTLILESSGSMAELEAEGMTVNDIMMQANMIVEMAMMSLEEIPEDIRIAYYECFDADDNYVLGKIEIIIPNQAVAEVEAEILTEAETEAETETEAVDPELVEEDDAIENEVTEDLVSLQIHWTADCSIIYADFVMEGNNGIEFISYKAPTEVSVTDEATVTSDAYQMIISLYTDGYIEFQAELDIACMASENANDTATARAFQFFAGYATEFETNAFEIILNEQKANVGNDLLINGTLECLIFTNDELMPIATLDYTVETGEPQGLPFEVDGQEDGIIYPGRMSEEEFAGWFNDEVMPNTTKVGLFILSQLPNEIVSTFINGME